MSFQRYGQTYGAAPFGKGFEAAARPDVRAAQVWRGDGADVIARLHQRLRHGGVPRVYPDPARV